MKTHQKTVDSEFDLKKLTAEMAAMPEKVYRGKLQFLKELMPSIHDMQDKGYTYADLVSFFNDHGLSISEATLNKALSRWRKEHKQKG